MDRLPPALFLCDATFPYGIQKHHRALFLSAPSYYKAYSMPTRNYRGETIAVTIRSISTADMPEPRIPATRYEMSNHIIILFFL